VFNDSPDEMIKNLPKDSAATIKATVNQLMNGDDSPAAIAKQQEVVDKCNSSTTSSKVSPAEC